MLTTLNQKLEIPSSRLLGTNVNTIITMLRNVECIAVKASAEDGLQLLQEAGVHFYDHTT